MSYLKKYPGALENTLYADKDNIEYPLSRIEDVYSIPSTWGACFKDELWNIEIGYITIPDFGHPVANLYRDKYSYGNKYLVARSAKETFFTIANAKKLVYMYYLNYPGVYTFSEMIADYR
jgi:hypothetical protein